MSQTTPTFNAKSTSQALPNSCGNAPQEQLRSSPLPANATPQQRIQRDIPVVQHTSNGVLVAH